MLAGKIILADKFLTRLKGLLGRKNLAPSEALVLNKCQMVHTCFMKFPIDIIFCDRNWKILATQHQLKPWRLSSFQPNSYYVIELCTDSLNKLDLIKDDLLELANE
ncbi:MAG: DUF192 domain-containing protein [Proteobacteria bacterium]|nr:DUF192 domain-containing protein [Pseudomonadota bacterium]